MKLTANVRLIDFDVKAWEEAVGAAGDRQLRLLVEEFLDALTTDPYGSGPGIPIWSGQARASIINAKSSQGQLLSALAPGVDTSLSPAPSALRRGLNFVSSRQSRGSSQGFFEFVTPPRGGPKLTFRFSFRSLVPHYVSNESSAGPPGLIKPTPWQSMRKVSEIVRFLWSKSALAAVIPNPGAKRFYKFPKVR